MHDISPISQLELIRRHSQQYVDKQGKRVRRDEGRIDARCVAASLLERFGGTIDWDRLGCEIGFGSIFQYMAAAAYAGNEKAMAKVEAAQEYEGQMKVGVVSLKESMLERFGSILYTVPRSAGSQQIEVITVDPDYIVNRETGRTAHEIWQERDIKIARGQIEQTYRRQAMCVGPDEARATIMRVVDKAANALVLPRPYGTKDHPLIGQP